MAIISKKHKFKPKSGEPWKLGNGEPIKVTAGQSLKSYADSYEKQNPSKTGKKFTWEDLALYNWGTKVPEEINWYLKYEVGCYKETKDGKNFTFQGDEDKDDRKTGRKAGTGIIFVPKIDPKTYSTNQEHIKKCVLPDKTPQISFKILNEFYEPIPKVNFTIFLQDNSEFKTDATNENGFYEIKDINLVPRDPYTIKLTWDDVVKNKSNKTEATNNTNDIVTKIVIAKLDQNIQGKVNEFMLIRIKPQRCIVDAHAHIENGSCAPLPLLWPNLPGEYKASRSQIEKGGKILDYVTKVPIIGTPISRAAKGWGGNLGHLQIKSTSEIGNDAVKEINEFFGSTNTKQSKLYKDADLFTFLVIQMMDMEYAHIGGFRELPDHRLKGFKGQTIYHESPWTGVVNEAHWHIYIRQNAKDNEDQGTYEEVPGENSKTFSKWEKQYLQTIDAMRNNPLRMMAMYHYEPRRWNYDTDTWPDSHLQKGPWDYPFDSVATKSNIGAFIGFKMYTRLGYKPLDERLPYLKDFYAECASKGIPILVHCSPGGMNTHEVEFYKQLDESNGYRSFDIPDIKKLSTNVPDKDSKNEKIEMIYFNMNYVHPIAWREVLELFPNLKLCLAHFGDGLWEINEPDKKNIYDPYGDWISEIIDLTKKPNVYSDFSCWNLDKVNKDDFKYKLKQYPHLKEKILFGTDWYMTLVALKGTTYNNFCQKFWDFFMDEKFEEGKELWQRFTFINPFKFYGFNDMATINNIVTFFRQHKLVKNEEILSKNLKSFHKLIIDFDKICKKIESGEQ